MEMRLGKSLCAIRYLKQVRPDIRVLILAPYSPLEGWRAELITEGIEQRDIHFWYASIADRKALLVDTENSDGWFLINKEAAPALCLEDYHWDAVIIDESTFIANPKAIITKWALSFAFTVSIRIILTGTPAPETPLQYFTQLAFVNSQKMPFRNYYQFRASWFFPVMHDWVLKAACRIKLAKLLEAMCFIRTRKDVGMIIEKTYAKRFVLLTPANRKTYLEAEDNWMHGGKILKFAGERWDVMRRLCGSTEKMIELDRIITTELKESKVVIWAWYVEEVLTISAHFNCDYICGEVLPRDRERIRKDFLKDDSKRILVAQPEVWRFGTNLVGVDTAIFFSSPCGLLTRQQVEERTVDVSKKLNTLVIDLVVKDSVDEVILKGLEAKESENKMIERMRHAIRSRNSGSRDPYCDGFLAR